MEEVEQTLPDYSLVPEYDSSIIFTTRGCIRNCSFCSVPKIEPNFKANKSIRHLIYPGHKKVILWDNNILASPYWVDIYNELFELKLVVDFNQGLDARLFNDDTANQLKSLKVSTIRLAYDSDPIKPSLKKAIDALKAVGIRGREILVYCLYNHHESPEDFLRRIKEIMNFGVVAYPMRYEPLLPSPKNTYISDLWTSAQLEMLAKARRVIGYGGAFPPYEGLRKKIIDAKNFEQAFALRN
ncbi:hypothetical protein EG832_17720 [bacterium]|nr:hypothetical protein [bacterium]